jgi:hypothetical protein
VHTQFEICFSNFYFFCCVDKFFSKQTTQPGKRKRIILEEKKTFCHLALMTAPFFLLLGVKKIVVLFCNQFTVDQRFLLFFHSYFMIIVLKKSLKTSFMATTLKPLLLIIFVPVF